MTWQSYCKRVERKLAFNFPECSYNLCKVIANEWKESLLSIFLSVAITYAKLAIKSEKPTPFGGLFSIKAQFDPILSCCEFRGDWKLKADFEFLTMFCFIYEKKVLIL